MSDAPKVEVLPIERGATPDPQNANKHTQRGGAMLSNSLQRRGAFRSIASAGKGVDTPVVYAGNYTLEKAVEAGFTEVVNVHVTGNQLVNVVRDDVEPGSPEAAALGVEDNEIGKQSYQADVDVLAALSAGDNALLSALKREDKTFGRMLEGMIGYGDTDTDRDGQGVNSTWDQVKSAQNELMKIGELEIRLPQEIAQKFIDFVTRAYETDKKPIFETATKILEIGMSGYENSRN